MVDLRWVKLELDFTDYHLKLTHKGPGKIQETTVTRIID